MAGRPKGAMVPRRRKSREAREQALRSLAEPQNVSGKDVPVGLRDLWHHIFSHNEHSGRA